MESATIFAIAVGSFAAVALCMRLGSQVARLAGPWLAARTGQSGMRDDFYAFYNLRDLTGEAPAKPKQARRISPDRRPRPAVMR